MAVVKQFGMFNVNKAADHLIPAENEKWLHCCRGGEGLRRGEWGPSGCDYAWLSSLQEDMYKCPAARLHYLCELIIRPVRENIHFTLLKLIRKKNKQKTLFQWFFLCLSDKSNSITSDCKRKKKSGFKRQIVLIFPVYRQKQVFNILNIRLQRHESTTYLHGGGHGFESCLTHSKPVVF